MGNSTAASASIEQLRNAAGEVLPQCKPLTGHRRPLAPREVYDLAHDLITSSYRSPLPRRYPCRSTRGLALCGPYAFVGLSKIRATSALDGVPLAERREQLKCGVAVVDLRSGQSIALLEFQTAVEEIFDVQLLPGLRFPEIMGFQKETLHHTFIIPPENPSAPRP
jgi:uncharacterized protein DUF4915